MTLSANRPLKELHRLSWKTNGHTNSNGTLPIYSTNPLLYPPSMNGDDTFQVTISPMEIRTYFVRFQPK